MKMVILIEAGNLPMKMKALAVLIVYFVDDK